MEQSQPSSVDGLSFALPTVAAFEAIFIAFEQAKAVRSLAWPAVFDEFAAAYKSARANRAVHTPRLNILEVFGLKKRELLHSRVLAWFLAEDSSHEQGGLFMECLLRLCGAPLPACTGYAVQRESPDRVDVAAYKNGSFAVFIENKVDHHERQQQLADLQNSLLKFSRGHQVPESHRVAVFLTDDGRVPVTAHPGAVPGLPPRSVRPIHRLTLFKAFSQALEAQTIKSKRLTSFLEAYLDSIASHSDQPL